MITNLISQDQRSQDIFGDGMITSLDESVRWLQSALRSWPLPSSGNRSLPFQTFNSMYGEAVMSSRLAKLDLIFHIADQPRQQATPKVSKKKGLANIINPTA